MADVKPKLTPAQQRAVDWLPKDGAWSGPALYFGTSLASLRRRTFDLIECKSDPTAHGRSIWRLTALGIATFHGDDNANG